MKQVSSLLRLFTTVLVLGILSLSYSEVSEARRGQAVRTKRRFGIMTGAYRTQFPMDVELSLAFNMSDLIRLRAGAGMALATPKATGVGGGIDLMIPGLRFSPFIGATVVKSLGTSTQIIVVDTFNGSTLRYTVGDLITSVQAGFDWTTAKGWTFGVGYSKGISPFSGGQLFGTIAYFFGKKGR